MKSFFRNLSSRFPFFANRPSALERAVRQSPKSRRLRMEPLENRALLAVDAFGGAASLLDSDVGATWGPDPAPAAFSASVLATDAAVIDLSGVDATLADATFSVQNETTEPVAPPSFEQLMEALGQVRIESLDDESDVASSSFLDAATDETVATSDAVVRRVVFEGSAVDAVSLDEPAVVVPIATVDAESASNGARSGGGDPIFYNVSCELTSSISNSFDDLSNPLSERVVVDGSTTTLDYLVVTLPEVPYGYYADVTIGGDAAYGSDFVVFTYNAALQRFELNSFYGSNFQHSGGATTFYIAPVDDDVTEPIETVTYTLSEPKPLGSGGGTLSADELVYGSLTATATIVDDDAEVVVYWRDGSDEMRGASLSGNPNGGGLRVFPEQTNSNEDSLRNQVDLVFRLNAVSSVDTTVYCRLLDPDNYISLGKNQPTDGSCAPNDNNWSCVLPNSVVIPAGEVEYVLPVTISNAYAGDNFIVVADTDSSAVAAAALGSNEATRYRLVQPVANQPAYTQMLTVWRTLWVERDQLAYQAENHIRFAEFPITAGLVSNAFQDACVLLQDAPTNSVSSIFGPLYLNTNSELETHENGLPQTYAASCLNSPIASNDKFWYAHLIGAFWADPPNVNGPVYGAHYSQSQGFSVPTAFIFNSALGANVSYASEFAQQVALAKLAYLWNADVPYEGIDGLSATQIREIQSSARSR